MRAKDGATAKATADSSASLRNDKQENRQRQGSGTVKAVCFSADIKYD
jgi:hypothetical protein